MGNTEINYDPVWEKAGIGIILITGNGKAGIGLFSKSSAREMLLYRESDIFINSLDLVNILDQYRPEKLTVVSTSTDFTIVPKVLTDGKSTDDRQWLEHLPFNGKRDLVLSDEGTSTNFKLIFSEKASVYEFFSQLSDNRKIRHLLAAIHENCQSNRLASVWSKVICFFLDKRFFVIAYRHNEIRLANSFDFEVPADVLYYMLWVKKEVFSDEEVTFYLNGMIANDSKLFKLLKSYFKDLKWGLGDTSGVSAADDKLPAHSFAILLEN